MNKLEYTQEMIVLNLYQLFDLIPEFQKKQTRTLSELLDFYIPQFDQTTKEWLRIFIAIANNPKTKENPTVDIPKEEIDKYYSEELFQEAIKPFLNLSIKTIKLDGYSSLEYYYNIVSKTQNTTTKQEALQ
jgi:hypothetical protein